MLEAVWIGFACSLGLLVRMTSLPPLVGYLAAGFIIAAISDEIGMPATSGEVLQHVSHLGVLLLLFTVGLKLNVRAMGKPEVRAFHGRVAIGILVMQDVFALVVMSVTIGSAPSFWALLAFGLPLLRPLLYRLLDASGHEDLLALSVWLSFVVSAPLNRLAHPLYERVARRLIPMERDLRHPDEQPVSLGDAEDQIFGENQDYGNVRAVILSLNEAEAKRIATQKLRKSGFTGVIVSHSMHQDEAREILAAGADQAYLTMSEAGVGLAEHVRQRILPGTPPAA
jgi:hypothetical protein